MPTITEVVNPEQSQPRMHWTAQVVAVAFVMLFFGVLLPHVPDWWQRMHCPGLQQVEAPTTFISVAAMRPNNNGSYEVREGSGQGERGGGCLCVVVTSMVLTLSNERSNDDLSRRS